jgi:mono/diheme cytochrome c family protein
MPRECHGKVVETGTGAVDTEYNRNVCPDLWDGSEYQVGGIMKTRVAQLMLALTVMVAFVGLAWADEAAEEEKVEHSYVGAKKCKICHKKDGVFPSWEATAHATAFDKLTDEQKADETYLKFYTTGTDEKGVLLEGVQCEACHGPGSDYKKKSVMEDREASIAAGLLIPDAETCARCHNADAPGALAATAKDFDFEKMKEKGVHVMKPAETE